VRLGLSPRGAIALTRAAQAYALAESRAYVLPEDFKALAHAVVAHRLVLTPDAQLRGRAAGEGIDQILDQLPVPPPPAGARAPPPPPAPPPRGGPPSRPPRPASGSRRTGVRDAQLRLPCRRGQFRRRLPGRRTDLRRGSGRHLRLRRGLRVGRDLRFRHLGI